MNKYIHNLKEIRHNLAKTGKNDITIKSNGNNLLFDVVSFKPVTYNQYFIHLVFILIF